MSIRLCSALLLYNISSLSWQVQSNVQAAKEALGLVQSETQSQEDAVLKEVDKMLKPIKNTTWPSGRSKNNEVHV